MITAIFFNAAVAAREDAVLAICNNEAPLIAGVPVGSALDTIFEDGNQFAVGLNLIFILILAGLLCSGLWKFMVFLDDYIDLRNNFSEEVEGWAESKGLTGKYLAEYKKPYELPKFWEIIKTKRFIKKWGKGGNPTSTISNHCSKRATDMANKAIKDSIKNERYL